jgi:DNA-binding transcriptional MerR regulator
MVSDAARLAKRSGATIVQWERKGWLPCQRTANGVRLFAPEDVRRVAAERAARGRDE